MCTSQNECESAMFVNLGLLAEYQIHIKMSSGVKLITWWRQCISRCHCCKTHQCIAPAPLHHPQTLDTRWTPLSHKNDLYKNKWHCQRSFTLLTFAYQYMKSSNVWISSIITYGKGRYLSMRTELWPTAASQSRTHPVQGLFSGLAIRWQMTEALDDQITGSRKDTHS